MPINVAMSRLHKVLQIRCGSHTFNLAIQRWISNEPPFEDISSKVASVVRKSSALKISAQL